MFKWKCARSLGACAIFKDLASGLGLLCVWFGHEAVGGSFKSKISIVSVGEKALWAEYRETQHWLGKPEKKKETEKACPDSGCCSPQPGIHGRCNNYRTILEINYLEEEFLFALKYER